MMHCKLRYVIKNILSYEMYDSDIISSWKKTWTKIKFSNDDFGYYSLPKYYLNNITLFKNIK